MIQPRISSCLYLVSLVPSLWEFLSFKSHALYTFGDKRPSRLSLKSSLTYVSHNKKWITYLWQESHKSDAMFLLHPV